MIAKQLFDICSNREFTLEQRQSSIEAIHYIASDLGEHKETRKCIIDIVNASKDNDIEPDLQKEVEELLNKWKS